MSPTERTPFAPGGDVEAAAGFRGAGTFFDEEAGLTTKEATSRLNKDGPNVLDPPVRESFFSILLTQMRNVIFLLTTVAAALTWSMGDEVKAMVLLGIVAFVCLANAIGEYSAQDAGAALNAMAAPKAVVVRDGLEAEVPSSELVVGDVVKLRIGDVVPADMRVLSCIDLRTVEAVLTGEPHEKRKRLEVDDPCSPFLSNMLYSATSVVGGHGVGLVVATGMRTQVGRIAKQLTVTDQTLGLNPLQQSINLLGAIIGAACMVVVVTASLVSIVSGYQNPSAPCPEDDDQCLIVTSVLRGLLMAVSLVPHGLPFVVMIMLRVGSMEMARRNAVVTRRSAVDYLGATSVICTDKTGTLTEGKMVAKQLIGLCRKSDGDGAQDLVPSALAFYPLRGLSPNGGLFPADELTPERKKKMDAAFVLREPSQSYADFGLPQLGASNLDEDMDALLARVHLACAFLNSTNTTLRQDPENGSWASAGNMSEAALVAAAAKGGYWQARMHARPAEDLSAKYVAEADLEVPFSAARKMAATVHRLAPDGSCRLESVTFPRGTTHVAIVKGAPDRLFAYTGQVLVKDGAVLRPSAKPVSTAERGAMERQNGDLARQGLRSLMVAVRPLNAQEASDLRGVAASDGADEILKKLLGDTRLCFISLWGIYDPPRAAVPASVRECHQAGIRVVMITGDQRATAEAIAKQVGILEEDALADQACLCSDMYMYDDCCNAEAADDSHQVPCDPASELVVRRTARANVWARAQPADKVNIVESLVFQGHTTAMTGDGVNDAPALKHAHVGVAMGISGTAVSKNASDLVLMDDDFSTIVAAVREGRRIYNNTQKYVVYNLSIKTGECGCLLFAIAAGAPMPIRGLQLLFNLICTHILPTLSLAWEAPEPYLMRVPPRETKRDLVVPRIMWVYKWIPFVATMMLCVSSCLRLGVWAGTGFTIGRELIGTSRVNAVERGEVACAYAGDLDPDGRFIEDAAPFHCRCRVRAGGSPWAPADVWDQWGPADADTSAISFDRWTGDVGDAFDRARTPWRRGAQTLLEACKDRRGIERWCWKSTSGTKPLLPLSLTCAAHGTVLGQSMAYCTIHLGEILSLLAFRMDAFSLRHVFTNPVYAGMLVFNLSALAMFLYFPPLSQLLGLAPLGPIRLAISVMFAIAMWALNEVAKVLYRQRLAAHNAALAEVAQQRACATPTHWDAEAAK